MTLDEYQQRAMATCTESSDNDTYAFFQLAAECGEMMDKVAKARRKNILTFYADQIDPDDNGKSGAGFSNEYVDFLQGVQKELGDVLWSVAQIATRFGWSLGDVAQHNLDKLADRAKRGVIVGEGDNR